MDENNGTNQGKDLEKSPGKLWWYQEDTGRPAQSRIRHRVSSGNDEREILRVARSSLRRNGRIFPLTDLYEGVTSRSHFELGPGGLESLARRIV